jgi:hypothetical protein
MVHFVGDYSYFTFSKFSGGFSSKHPSVKEGVALYSILYHIFVFNLVLR